MTHDVLESETKPVPTADRLSDVLTSLVRELHPEMAARTTVHRDSALDKDLGIDSLSRVELLLRLEQTFGVKLPEDAVMTAETPADLLTALLSSQPEATAELHWDTSTVHTPADAPDFAETLVDVLAYHKDAHGDRVHVNLLGTKNDVWTLTYRELWDGAQEIAAGIATYDFPKGSAIAIMLPTSEDFFLVFMGILLAGGVPVPIYPPVRRSQIEDHLRRQAGILRNGNVPLLITTAEAAVPGKLIQAQVESVRAVVSPGELRTDRTADVIPQLIANDLGLLQYTSGSTGDPKGVMLTHGNLLANIRALINTLNVTSDDVVVSWLPLYHDMGLIGMWLGSLYTACPFVVMSPMTFLARPVRWLQAIDRYKGSISAAPNFAYELLLTKVPDKDIDGLDLSSWRMTSNGAERISQTTLKRFQERFGPLGFKPGTMTPMYGLAESAVGLTTTPLGRGPVFEHLKRDELLKWGRAAPATDDDPTNVNVVSCGVPLPHHEVRIVDKGGKELGDREEGLIQFRGPSATVGYLNAPDKTAALIRDGWLETGDKGYIAKGELYMTGRVKDMIIRAGRNLHPDEIEDALGNIDGVQKGKVAVFASDDEQAGTERLIVLCETRQRNADRRAKLEKDIAALVTELTDGPPDEIVLAPPGSVVKTPNGKVRRNACRQLFETGQLGRKQSALWLQIASLLRASAGPELRRWWRAVGALAYAIRFVLMIALVAPVAYAGVIILPGLSRRRRFLRFVAQCLLRLLGLAPKVTGLAALPNTTFVLLANHGSYLDGLVLAASIPADHGFAVKAELMGSVVASTFLRRIGAIFVERFDPSGGVEATDDLTDALKAGENLTVFPEGTFDRQPGLRPFQLGGFIAACRAGTPVIPIGISGTRAVLRGDNIFARRGNIVVEIGEPIQPSGTDWQAAIALRDDTRAAILPLCHEPDLHIPVQLEAQD